MKVKDYDFILASGSPRREQLLRAIGIPFSVQIPEVDETYLHGLVREEIPLFLAEKKARWFDGQLKEKMLVIAADTIVWIDGKVMGKPAGYKEAVKMLTELSGQMHEVVTGICLRSKHKTLTFCVSSKVFFKKLSKSSIAYYVKKFTPYDKAGAYGIQEWIGMIGVRKVVGSTFNVMGFPIKELYKEIRKF